MPRRDDEPLPAIGLVGAFSNLIAAAIHLFAQGMEVIALITRGHRERASDRIAQSDADADLEALMQSVKLRAAAVRIPDKSTLRSKLLDDMMAMDIDRRSLYPAKVIWSAFFDVAWDMLQQERIEDIEPATYTNNIEKGRYIDYLIKQAEKLKVTERSIPLFLDAISHSLAAFCKALPDSAFLLDEEGKEQPYIGTVPAHLTIGNFKDLILDMMVPYFREDVKEIGLFKQLHGQLNANDERAGGVLPPPTQFKGTQTELVDAYLGGTPFKRLATIPIPFNVPLAKQLEHGFVAAGSRYGKSQLIGSIIAAHLQSDEPPGIIVIDSTGDFAEKISHLQLFAPGEKLHGRLLVIDPADAPQLNMFDLSTIRAKGYGASDYEQVEADIINLFSYVFASIGSDLTAQQGAGFTFLVRLLLSIPGSNLNTLREILELPVNKYADVPTKIRSAIEVLDPVTQSYFRNQFFTLNMLTTRQAVARRLYNLLQIPTFERMFSGGNRIDFFQAMQDGKIIVVNTAKTLLQTAPSALFGRYIIARVMSGAFERTVIKDMSKRRPCLLFIDEAQEYFDESIDTLLTQIGKFKLGICLAFQYFGQMDDKLRNSVLGNTTVKFAGGLNVSESNMIARELRVDTEFLLDRRKDPSDPPQWGEFAIHIKYSNTRALPVYVPYFVFERMPKMSPETYRELMLENRRAVAGTPQIAQQPKPEPKPDSVIITPPPQPKTESVIILPPPPKSPPPDHETGATNWE